MPARISKASRVAGFRKGVAAGLRPLGPRLTKVLKTLIEHPYPEDFWQLDFEIHDFEYGFPAVVYFYREGFDQVMEDDKQRKAYPFKVPQSLIKSKRIYPAALEKKFRVNEDEYWFDDAACKQFIPWFHACWLKAGGKKFPFRARIAGHDSSKRFDLVRGKWTRDG